ncbi:MAG: hypothetical protein KY442_13420, partial [Proteobacteria bacterium]|nr:hypothetical protein [Pseudomonadota bacterium]
LADRSTASVAAALDRGDAAVIGPGLGLSDDAREMLQRVLASNRPAVIDADALTLIAESPKILGREGGERLLLTPHPGEMARLLQTQVPEVTRDPIAAGLAAAERFAILETGQCIALEVGGKCAAHTGLHAPAVGAEVVAEEVAAGVELLVGHTAEQVHARVYLVVVAQADAPLVEVDVAVVEFLVAVAAEQVEVRRDRAGAVDGQAIGIAAVGAGAGVAAFQVGVGHAFGRGGGGTQGEGGQNGEQGQGKQ